MTRNGFICLFHWICSSSACLLEIRYEVKVHYFCLLSLSLIMWESKYALALLHFQNSGPHHVLQLHTTATNSLGTAKWLCNDSVELVWSNQDALNAWVHPKTGYAHMACRSGLSHAATVARSDGSAAASTKHNSFCPQKKSAAQQKWIGCFRPALFLQVHAPLLLQNAILFFSFSRTQRTYSNYWIIKSSLQLALLVPSRRWWKGEQKVASLIPVIFSLITYLCKPELIMEASSLTMADLRGMPGMHRLTLPSSSSR
jgi:hypothetical protein